MVPKSDPSIEALHRSAASGIESIADRRMEAEDLVIENFLDELTRYNAHE